MHYVKKEKEKLRLLSLVFPHYLSPTPFLPPPSFLPLNLFLPPPPFLLYFFFLALHPAFTYFALFELVCVCEFV